MAIKNVINLVFIKVYKSNIRAMIFFKVIDVRFQVSGVRFRVSGVREVVGADLSAQSGGFIRMHRGMENQRGCIVRMNSHLQLLDADS